MKRSLRSRWLEALRSGAYTQGKNFLRVNDSYCCLGVLCDIIDHDGWSKIDNIFPQLDPNDVVYEHSSGEEALYYNQRFKCFLSKKDIINCEDGVLTGLNDTENKNFNEIADWIEENIVSEPD